MRPGIPGRIAGREDREGQQDQGQAAARARVARRSAAGSIATSHSGANQNIQRKPLVMPP